LTIGSCNWAFKELIVGSVKSKMAEIRHLENWHDVIFFCRGWSDLDKISETGSLVQNDMSTVVMWSKSKPYVEFQYGGRLGKFNGMSSQSHVSHCRVLPLGDFAVTIPEPHATLQGVRIPSAILKIVLHHIFFVLMQFRLWWAAAFVSSPIHLFVLFFVLYGTEYILLFNYMMTTLTCSFSLRHITVLRQPLTSLVITPAGDDVTRSAHWCEPCGEAITVDREEIDSLDSAAYELQMAINATIPLATRLQRYTMVCNAT